MNYIYALVIILIAAMVTFLIRLFPFVLFKNKKRELPKPIVYLGDILPQAVMAILIVYSLRYIQFKTISGFLPELIAVAVVVVAHIIKRNNLLSIGLGTAVYMLLIQFVFIH
jgi:branched-subunit amino acid transport protein AzlD